MTHPKTLRKLQDLRDGSGRSWDEGLHQLRGERESNRKQSAGGHIRMPTGDWGNAGDPIPKVWAESLEQADLIIYGSMLW